MMSEDDVGNRPGADSRPIALQLSLRSRASFRSLLQGNLTHY